MYKAKKKKLIRKIKQNINEKILNPNQELNLKQDLRN